MALARLAPRTFHRAISRAKLEFKPKQTAWPSCVAPTTSCRDRRCEPRHDGAGGRRELREAEINLELAKLDWLEPTKSSSNGPFAALSTASSSTDTGSGQICLDQAHLVCTQIDPLKVRCLCP